MTRTIAVFGGSFDPPHVAHTLACAYVLSAHPVDLVLVVPTARHPFDKQLTAFEHRVHMTELAMRDLRRVEVSSIEHDRPGPSLTLHTLEQLKREHPDAALRLVIGSDLLPETGKWHEFERVKQLAPALIVQRAGAVSDASVPALPEISSSMIRQRLRAGQSVDGLVCPQVLAYARAHGLYSAGSA